MKRKDTQPELPSFGRKNESRWVELPSDFDEKAREAGHDPDQLLWRFAENYCARYPVKIEVTERKEEPTPSLPPGVIPFPGIFRAA